MLSATDVITGRESTSAADAITNEMALAGLARCIRSAVESAEKHAKNAVTAAVTAGHNLYMAKQRVPHGEWGTWVTTNTTLSVRTAQAYMKLAARTQEIGAANAQRVTHLPIREALKAIATPSKRELAQPVQPAAHDRAATARLNELEATSVDFDYDRSVRKTWAFKVREAVANLESFATCVESGKTVSKAQINKLREELEAALSLVRALQRDPTYLGDADG